MNPKTNDDVASTITPGGPSLHRPMIEDLIAHLTEDHHCDATRAFVQVTIQTKAERMAHVALTRPDGSAQISIDGGALFAEESNFATLQALHAEHHPQTDLHPWEER